MKNVFHSAKGNLHLRTSVWCSRELKVNELRVHCGSLPMCLKARRGRKAAQEREGSISSLMPRALFFFYASSVYAWLCMHVCVSGKKSSERNYVFAKSYISPLQELRSPLFRTVGGHLVSLGDLYIFFLR